MNTAMSKQRLADRMRPSRFCVAQSRFSPWY